MLYYFILLIAFIIAFFIVNDRLLKNFPPGPFCFPIIGSWYCVPGQGIETKVPEWQKKYGNIIGYKVGRKSLIVIVGFKETLSALKTKNFQNRMYSVTSTYRTFNQVLGLFFADGEQYNEIRRFTVRFLGQAAATGLESIMREEMMIFFSTVESGKVTKIDGEFMSFIMLILLTFLIGNLKESVKNEAQIHRELVYKSFRSGRFTGIEHFYPLFRIFCPLQHQIVANKYSQDFCKRRVEEHKKSFDPEKIRDYIDAFLLEQSNEKRIGQTEYYTDKELISCLMDLVFSASESTGNTATFILLYVALHPQVQGKMHEELDRVLGNRFPVLENKANLSYCVAVIEETLRINIVAATSVPHVASEDTEFYGYTIPKGAMILFPLWNMFRSSDNFDDPESFKPERFTSKEVKSKVVSFGVGKRSCAGAFIVKKTLFLFVTYFFQKYSVSLPKGCEYPDTEPILGFTNAAKPFHLIITDRQSK